MAIFRPFSGSKIISRAPGNDRNYSFCTNVHSFIEKRSTNFHPPVFKDVPLRFNYICLTWWKPQKCYIFHNKNMVLRNTEHHRDYSFGKYVHFFDEKKCTNFQPPIFKIVPLRFNCICLEWPNNQIKPVLWPFLGMFHIQKLFPALSKMMKTIPLVHMSIHSWRIDVQIFILLS